jgi:hypothetical protein
MKTKPPKDARDIEVYPDAWKRFERAVDVVMKPKLKAKERPAPKGHAHKGNLAK